MAAIGHGKQRYRLLFSMYHYSSSSLLGDMSDSKHMERQVRRYPEIHLSRKSFILHTSDNIPTQAKISNPGVIRSLRCTQTLIHLLQIIDSLSQLSRASTKRPAPTAEHLQWRPTHLTPFPPQTGSASRSSHHAYCTKLRNQAIRFPPLWKSDHSLKYLSFMTFSLYSPR